MECPHLADNCKIGRELVKSQKCQLIDRCTRPSDVVLAPGSAQRAWRCSECLSSKDNWMCLLCGSVLCSRYEKGHALNHFHSADHMICMNTTNLSVYCYKCDDFVINETPEVDDLRLELKTEDDSCSETSTNAEESSSSSKSQSQQETSLNDSSWEEPRLAGRKLRPRKRTISSDSSEGAKRKTLRKFSDCFLRRL